MKLLIINPGSTSTKLALYDGAEKLVQESLDHDAAELQQYHTIAEQVPMRLSVIRSFMERNGIDQKELAAVIGRGGLVFGLRTGGYIVDDELCRALVDDELSQPHASNLGGLLARELAQPLGIPAYIYDAVTSGELTDIAKITGYAEIERQSFCHVLNSRAMSNNINSPTINIETEILFDKLWNADADVASILGQIATVYRNNLQ